MSLKSRKSATAQEGTLQQGRDDAANESLPGTDRFVLLGSNREEMKLEGVQFR